MGFSVLDSLGKHGGVCDVSSFYDLLREAIVYESRKATEVGEGIDLLEWVVIQCYGSYSGGFLGAFVPNAATTNATRNPVGEHQPAWANSCVSAIGDGV